MPWLLVIGLVGSVFLVWPALGLLVLALSATLEPLAIGALGRSIEPPGSLSPVLMLSWSCMGCLIGGYLGCALSFRLHRRRSIFIWTTVLLAATLGFAEWRSQPGQCTTKVNIGRAMMAARSVSRWSSAMRPEPAFGKSGSAILSSPIGQDSHLPVEYVDFASYAGVAVRLQCDQKSDEYAAMFADSVERFYLVRDIDRERVRMEIDLWISLYPTVHECLASDFNVTTLSEDRVAVSFLVAWDVEGSGGRDRMAAESSMDFVPEAGEWRIKSVFNTQVTYRDKEIRGVAK